MNHKALQKMKKHILTAVTCLIGATSGLLHASDILSDNFNSYTDGALVGQGTWLQSGSTATNPIQVVAGDVLMGIAGGQDVYDGFTGGAITLSPGDVITSTLDFSVTSATATGDYFFHLSNPLGTTSNFYSRLYVKSGGGGGFLLGLSGSNNAATYGTTELTLNTVYAISLTWTIVAGTANDTFDLTVDASSYLAGIGYGAGSVAEPAALAAINLRQGGATSSAGVTIKDVSVDYAAVPEPGTVALVGIGLATVIFGASRPRP
jgi:hypothetical protein